MPTALGNFVGKYCTTAQPSPFAQAEGEDRHGDLLPINPGAITPEIADITPGNIDWVKIIVISINYQYCVGWAKPVCVPFPAALTTVQKAAISHLGRQVTSNIITADTLASYGECEKLLSSKKYDYAGRPVEYMEDLECEKVIQAWPKAGQAGVQPITAFLTEETRALLMDPRRLLLPPDKMPQNALKSKVRATDDEWFRIVKEAAARGMMRPVEDSLVPRDRAGHLITNGAGAVRKEKVVGGKTKVCQRFISILCPINAVTEPIPGSQDTLPYIGQMTGLMLEENEALFLESEDLQSAFNLFSVPDNWLGFFAYAKKVDSSAFGLPPGKQIRPALSVVPMGWHSAVALVQEAVRELVFNRAGVPKSLSIEKGKPLPPGPNFAVVYLDNFDEIRVIRKLDAELTDEGQEMSDYHKKFNLVCDQAGLPRNLGKQLIHAYSGGMQGGHFDGLKGVLKIGPDKLRNYIQLSMALLSRKQWKEFHLRHWAGKTAFMATFKRSLFAGMACIFTAIENSTRGPIRPFSVVLDEIFILMVQSPLSQTNLRASMSMEVSCTDASPTGGGSGVATKFKPNPISSHPVVEFKGTCGTCDKEMATSTMHQRYKCPSKCGKVLCSIGCLSKHRLLCCRDEYPKMVFGERFSGPEYPLTKAAGLQGLHVQPPLDILREGDSWDFFTPTGKERLDDLCDEGNLKAEHWAPECKTFSAARGKPVHTTSGRRIRGPPALRSRDKPWGLSGLSPTDQIKVRQGNAMAKRSLQGLREGHARGKLESLEHPWSSWLWLTEEAEAVATLEGMMTTGFSHCCFGGRRVKWTCILHNIPRLHELMNMEACPGHPELLPYEVHDNPDGTLTFDTAEEATYPWAMCRTMARAIHEQLERQNPSPRGDMPFDSETAIVSFLRSATKGFQCQTHAVAAARKVIEVMQTMRQGQEREHLKYMMRLVCLRGTDVKLETEAEDGSQSTMAPYPAFMWDWAIKLAYRWKQPQHINELEVAAFLVEFRRRTRSPHCIGCRFFNVTDSRVMFHVLTKGRSSSPRLNRLLRRVNSLILMADCLPVHFWTISKWNFADTPSRLFEE